MSLNELIIPKGNGLPISCSSIDVTTISSVTVLPSKVVTTITATGTISASVILGGIVSTAGISSSQTLTTDTAANIVAAVYALLPAAAVVGTSFSLMITNPSSNAVTLAGGTGVTTSGLASTTLAATSARGIWFVITNAGTPAVSVYG